MKRRHLLLRTIGLAAAAASATSSTAQDRVAVAPDMKVLLENECVRVQYHDVDVGESIPMHSHPNYIVYVLNSFRARITFPDGTQAVSESEAGKAYWKEAESHSVENIGQNPIHNLIIELKSSASCK
jgi:hypothetical protein